jgi:hypothetical protein
MVEIFLIQQSNNIYLDSLSATELLINLHLSKINGQRLLIADYQVKITEGNKVWYR